MIYLILAIISSMLVSVIMRLSETRIHNNLSMLASNYLMCTAIAALYTGTTAVFPANDALPVSLGLGVISGFFYLSSFILLQWNIRENGVSLSSMFMKLGVMVPSLMAIFCFHEVPKFTQVIGMVLAVVAILLINLDKGSGHVASFSGLILLLLAGGATDAMSKVHEELGSAALKSHFLMYTFFVALVLCAALCVIRGQKLTGSDLGFGLLIGVPNYFSARFLLLSLTDVPAMIAYPTYSVATIVLVAVVSMVLFSEKLSKRQIGAMAIIMAALALLNI